MTSGNTAILGLNIRRSSIRPVRLVPWIGNLTNVVEPSDLTEQASTDFDDSHR